MSKVVFICMFIPIRNYNSTANYEQVIIHASSFKDTRLIMMLVKLKKKMEREIITRKLKLYDIYYYLLLLCL